MEFALALLKLWRLKLWVAGGIVLAALIAFATMSMGKTTVYAAAATNMLIDSPRSALGNTQADLTPLVSRAGVFARLMTSAEALNYIGRSAHIPGNLIAATGPEEIGTPQATHTPSATTNGKLTTAAAAYSLRFDQNPLLPTIDVYAEAPTAQQAIALANGAVTGFATYIDQLESQGGVPAGRRVTIRQLGTASGGQVSSGMGKTVAVVAFFVVMIIWCFLVLMASKVRGNIGAARARGKEQDATATPDFLGFIGDEAYGAGEGPAATPANGSAAAGSLADAVARSQLLER